MLKSLNMKSIFILALSLSVFAVSMVHLYSKSTLVQAPNNATLAADYLNADKLSLSYVAVDNDVAKTLAHGLVKQQIAISVKIIPQVTSIYRWNSEVKEENELLLIIKTTTSQVDQVTKFVCSDHKNKACEVISLPISDTNPVYLKWIGNNLPENLAKSCQT